MTRIILGIALIALACAPKLQIDTPPSDRKAAARDSLPYSHLNVQVRYFPRSPDVAIVAWDPAENGYGLRATLNSNGTIAGDHRIFVRTYYLPSVRDMPRAVAHSRQLVMTGVTTDEDRCEFGACTPPETFGARIPDGLLRSLTDSLEVKFYSSSRDFTLIVRHDLINAYLAKLDSVSAQLKQR